MTQSPNTIFVREAGDDDAETLRTHRSESAKEATRYRGSPASPSVSTALTFVAGIGDTVFGSLSAGATSTDAWEITHVYVEPTAREIGIGDALMQRCLGHLRGMGVLWLGASALPGDRAMKNLFERHGLVAQTIIVGKSLSDPSTAADASQ
ncbi:MAG: GNAT family N-acetyltransferase [Acidimicrobiaceae bacterium]